MHLTPFGWDPFSGENFPSFPAFFKGAFPKIDVQETAQHVIVTADIPGVDPKKINVEISADAIKLSGTAQEEKEQKGKNFYRKERSSHSFERVVPLPCRVKETEAKANAKNGVLTITLPKIQSEAPKMKKIPVEEE